MGQSKVERRRRKEVAIFASVVCVRKERLSSPPVSLPPSPPRLLATMRHGEFLLPTLHGFLLTAVIADCR